MTFLGFYADRNTHIIIDHYICFFQVWTPWFHIFSVFWATVALAPEIICIVVVMVIYIRLLYISCVRHDRIAALGWIVPRRDTKFSTTFFYVGLSMVIGYLPYLLVSFLLVNKVSIPRKFVIFTRVCFASNGWWNVLIYYKRNKLLRKTFNQLIQETIFSGN